MTQTASPIQVARDAGIARFAEGFNCAEAVWLGVTEAFGGAEQVPTSIVTGFGGGMARHGEICGAVTGAILAIGLYQGRRDAQDVAARERTYASVDNLMAQFCEACGSLDCRQLIGCDLHTEEGRKLAAERRTHQDICPKFVALAATLAAEQIAR